MIGDQLPTRRVYGTECEYAMLLLSSQSGEPTSYGLSTHQLQEGLPAGTPVIGHFLGNGAKLHMDVGHPEYALGEVDVVADVPVGEEAADETVLEAVTNAAAKLGLAGFELNRRVLDHTGDPLHAAGYHENILVSRADYTRAPERSDLVRAQLIHAATRSIYAGAGIRLASGAYLLAQKASIVNRDTASSATNERKPMIKLLDEPHMPSRHGARLQVVCGDPNMAPLATLLKIGTSSLVADAVELGYDLSQWYGPAEGVYKIANQVAGDLTLRRTVELANGSSIRPIELQGELHAIIDKMLTGRPELTEDPRIGAERRMIAQLWRMVLDDLEQGRDHVVTKLDWPLRLLQQEHFQDKHGFADDAPELVRKDYEYDTLRPRTGKPGIVQRMRESHWSPWIPDPQAVADRKANGSPYTRAATRGRFVVSAAGREGWQRAKCEWSTLKPAGRVELKLSEPLQTSYPAVEAYIAETAA